MKIELSLIFLILVLFPSSRCNNSSTADLSKLFATIRETYEQEREGIWTTKGENKILGYLDSSTGLFRISSLYGFQNDQFNSLALSIYDGIFLDQKRIDIKVEDISNQSVLINNVNHYPIVMIMRPISGGLFIHKDRFECPGHISKEKSDMPVTFNLISPTCNIKISLELKSPESVPIISFALFFGTQLIIPISTWEFSKRLETTERFRKRYAASSILLFIDSWFSFHSLSIFITFAKTSVINWVFMFFIMVIFLIFPVRVYHGLLLNPHNRFWHFIGLAYGQLPLLCIYIFHGPDIPLVLQSLWLIPQIGYNYQTTRRSKWSYLYIFGMSFSYLTTLVYLKAYHQNIYRFSPDFSLVYSGAFLTIIQKKDSRFFLEEKENMNMYVEMKDLSRVKEDLCCVCLQEFSATPVQNREVVETKCKHFYHKACLIGWIKVKPFCPKCRASIDPYLLLDEMESVLSQP